MNSPGSCGQSPAMLLAHPSSELQRDSDSKDHSPEALNHTELLLPWLDTLNKQFLLFLALGMLESPSERGAVGSDSPCGTHRASISQR